MPQRSAKAAVVAACGLLLVLAGPVLAADHSGKLEQRVRRLENVAGGDRMANLLQRLNALEQEVRQLRGKIQELGHRIDQSRKRERNLYADLDRRLKALEASSGGAGDRDHDGAGGDTSGSTDAGAESSSGGNASAVGSTGSDKQSGGKGGQGSGNVGGDAHAAYDQAFDQLKNGRYDKAAAAFEAFLQQHPDSGYADNAEYWLGESRYVQRQFKPALAAFRAVVEDYPDSPKVPGARLKMGYALYELGRMDEARSVLQKVAQAQPDSTTARLARKRLDKIKQQSGQ